MFLGLKIVESSASRRPRLLWHMIEYAMVIFSSASLFYSGDNKLCTNYLDFNICVDLDWKQVKHTYRFECNS